jgi:mannose-1-phosphate guanylyltransferase/phosphomannomutase
MARLCGRPVIEHILDLLGENGIDEAALTLRYLPEIIKSDFPSGEFNGIKLRFVEEDEPLGTAGSVKNAADGFDSDFIVISGDALCDFNLKAALNFHREKGAAATLILSRVGDPREYGLVVTDPSGAVQGFVEKPGWAQAVTDAVNTGIYILSPACLELIPQGKEFDFAKDLFPLMLSKGMRLFGFEAEGYWCDIGDIGAYTSCQFDMLDGRVDCHFEGLERSGIYYKGRMPEGNFTVMPPVYFGEGVRIGDYSTIGPFVVIDDGCSVGLGASIKNSVMLPGSYAGDHSELRGALVCAGASLKRRAGMYEGSVAGEGSVIGADSSVSPGVRIWPGKFVEDGARAAANVKSGSARRGVFDDEGITGEVGADLTPEVCARIGAAVGGVFDSGRIGVGCDGSIAGANLKNSAAAGVLSAGAEVCDFGGGFESLFNFAVSFFELDIGAFVRMSGNRAVLKLSSGGGLGIGRASERKIEAAVSTGEIRRCSPGNYREPFSLPGVKSLYKRELLKYAPAELSGIAACAKSPNREVQKLLGELLHTLGCSEGGIRTHIDAAGCLASFFDEDGSYVTPAQTLALGCVAAFEKGEDVALPYDAPHVIDDIAAKYGRHVLRYLSCPADKSDAQARKLALSQTWVRDGLANAIRVLAHVKTRGITLAKMSKQLPDFAVSVKAVTCTVNPGLILRSLMSEKPDQPSEGVLLSRANGRVLVNPLKRGTGLRIMAEAADMETASELCAEMERKLNGYGAQAIDNSKNNS